MRWGILIYNLAAVLTIVKPFSAAADHQRYGESKECSYTGTNCIAGPIVKPGSHGILIF